MKKQVRFVIGIWEVNTDRKWWELWKPDYFLERYEVIVKNGRLYKGKKIK